MPRKRTDTIQLKLRFSEGLRRRLASAAERNQQSMNAEIVARLEASFSRDDAFGGPELHQIATLMAATFINAGKVQAGPGVSSEKWVHDAAIRLHAAFCVPDALLIGMATDDPKIQEIIETELGRLESRISGRVRNSIKNQGKSSDQ
jgi:hypothetical protein